MLIVMCGYPGSGKSTFLDLSRPFLEALKAPYCIVRPSDWHPEDFNDMLQDAKSQYQIACWEYALDKTVSLLTRKDRWVFLDTCGASFLSFETIISTAKLHLHRLCAIVVATSASTCIRRMGHQLIQKYMGRIPEAVRLYKEHFDLVLVVRDGDLTQWQDRARQVAHRLHQLSVEY